MVLKNLLIGILNIKELEKVKGVRGKGYSCIRIFVMRVFV